MARNNPDEIREVIAAVERMREGGKANITPEAIEDFLACLKRAENGEFDKYLLLEKASKLAPWFDDGAAPDQKFVQYWFLGLMSRQGVLVSKDGVEALTETVEAIKVAVQEVRHGARHPEDLPEGAQPYTEAEAEAVIGPAAEATEKIAEALETLKPVASEAPSREEGANPAETIVEADDDASADVLPPTEESTSGRAKAYVTQIDQEETETVGNRKTTTRKRTFEVGGELGLSSPEMDDLIRTLSKALKDFFSFAWAKRFLTSADQPDPESPPEPQSDHPVKKAIGRLARASKRLRRYIPAIGKPWAEKASPLKDEPLLTEEGELREAMKEAMAEGNTRRADLLAKALGELWASQPILPRSLDFHRGAVLDLSALRNLNNLKSLSLSGSQVSDIKPLRSLTELTSLYLTGTQVSDIEPLRSLTNLRWLYLGEMQIADMEPLRNLTELVELYLARSQVSNTEPLRNLTNLSMLNLNGTQIADIEPLRNLTNLSGLYLSGTQVADVEPLRNLTNLSKLYLSGTQVADIEPLRNLTKLSTLSLDRTKVLDIETLSRLDNLKRLFLSEHQTVDTSVRDHLEGLEIIWV